MTMLGMLSKKENNEKTTKKKKHNKSSSIEMNRICIDKSLPIQCEARDSRRRKIIDKSQNNQL
jgi:hypothetical protein